MLYSIQKYGLLANEDFSDFVTSLSDVPFFARERDYSLIAEGYNFKLSNQCPIAIAKDDRILFYRDEILVHIGFVDIVTLDEDSRLYNVKVRHVILDLQKRNSGESIRVNDPQTFMKNMLDNSGTVTLFSVDYTLISAKKLIETIFGEISFFSFALDWTNASLFNTLIDYNFNSYNIDDGTIDYVENIPIEDFYFLPQQVNGINQNGVFSPANIVNDDMKANRINLFELLSILCSIFGIGFIPKDETAFYVVSVRPVMASDYLDDNIIYDIETVEELKEAEGIKISYKTCAPNLLLSSASSPAWSAGLTYDKNQLVSHNTAVWIATKRHFSTTNDYPGNTNVNYHYYWLLVSVSSAGDYYISDDPVLNGDNENFYIEVVGTNGVTPKTANWYDNLDLIIESAGGGYIASLKLADINTPLKNQVNALSANYVKKTITTEADKFINHLLYNVEAIRVTDINLDLVEIETAERV